MKNILKKYKFIIIFVLALVLLGAIPHLVYAATTSKLNFCQYGGTRRTFKILGLAINIIKIIVPLILIITGVITLSKTIFTGKDDDLKSSALTLVKKAVAGVIIFLLPTALDYAFDTLVGYDDSSFTACTECMLNPDNCQIPTEDPDTYTE